MNEIRWNPSYFYLPRNETKKLEYKSSDAVNLTMTASAEYSLDDSLQQFIYFTWNIEWKKLEEERKIEGFSGDFQVLYYKKNQYALILKPKFEVEFTKYQSKSIKVRIGKFEDFESDDYDHAALIFELHLKPLASQEIPKNELLENSRNLDGILIIEGHKVPVSKSFLSMHSDYFEPLFGSDFKEKSMNEIPIEDVKYRNFIKLMDFLWLRPSVLTEDTVEGLLELANRFLMPFVMDNIEHFLMNNCKLEFTRLFYLAEKYNLKKLKEKCIGAITEQIQVKILRDSGYFDHFSQETKNLLLDAVLKLIK